MWFSCHTAEEEQFTPLLTYPTIEPSDAWFFYRMTGETFGSGLVISVCKGEKKNASPVQNDDMAFCGHWHVHYLTVKLHLISYSTASICNADMSRASLSTYSLLASQHFLLKIIKHWQKQVVYELHTLFTCSSVVPLQFYKEITSYSCHKIQRVHALF